MFTSSIDYSAEFDLNDQCLGEEVEESFVEGLDLLEGSLNSQDLLNLSLALFSPEDSMGPDEGLFCDDSLNVSAVQGQSNSAGFQAPIQAMLDGPDLTDNAGGSVDQKTTLKKRGFVCPHNGCGKLFNQRGNLNVHKKIHIGEKSFVCAYVGCGKEFSRKQSLEGHIRTHTGEKPFRCQLCGKGVALNSNLKSHMRTHTGERLFVKKAFRCKICGKGCVHRGDLNAHMRTHTGEKPFICMHADCGGKFSTSSILKRHQKRAHKEAADDENDDVEGKETE